VSSRINGLFFGSGNSNDDSDAADVGAGGDTSRWARRRRRSSLASSSMGADTLREQHGNMLTEKRIIQCITKREIVLQTNRVI